MEWIHQGISILWLNLLLDIVHHSSARYPFTDSHFSGWSSRVSWIRGGSGSYLIYHLPHLCKINSMPDIRVVLQWDHIQLYYVILSSRASCKIRAVPWVERGTRASERELQGFPVHLGGKHFATLQPNTALTNICCLVIPLDTPARCTLRPNLFSDTFLKVWNVQKTPHTTRHCS